jgi:hypothetical protein
MRLREFIMLLGGADGCASPLVAREPTIPSTASDGLL